MDPSPKMFRQIFFTVGF